MTNNNDKNYNRFDVSAKGMIVTRSVKDIESGKKAKTVKKPKTTKKR